MAKYIVFTVCSDGTPLNTTKIEDMATLLGDDMVFSIMIAERQQPIETGPWLNHVDSIQILHEVDTAETWLPGFLEAALLAGAKVVLVGNQEPEEVPPSAAGPSTFQMPG